MEVHSSPIIDEKAVEASRLSSSELIAQIQIDSLGSTPLYRQLFNELTRLIANGTLSPGDAVPTEEALCGAFGLSRTTVRRALGDLVEVGRVVRRPRKGTVVAEPKLPRSLETLHNFSEEMGKLGLTPTSKVLGFEKTTPRDWVAARLGVSEAEPVFKLTRVRLANGEPMLLETAWVPCRLCPNLTKEQLEGSLYTALAAAGHTAKDARETYEAVLLGASDAKALGRKKGDPTFVIRRSTSDETGTVFEVSRIVAPGDRNQYEVALHADAPSNAGIVPVL